MPLRSRLAACTATRAASIRVSIDTTRPLHARSHVVQVGWREADLKHVVVVGALVDAVEVRT
jgi:hypothetical protein